MSRLSDILKLLSIAVVLALALTGCTADRPGEEDEAAADSTSQEESASDTEAGPIGSESPAPDSSRPDSSGTVSTIANADGSTTSAIPELTPAADLPVVNSDEVHVAYAPDVPPPITRSEQTIIEIDLEVVEGVCPLDPGNGVDTLMWGYRVDGDEDVTCGSPGPVLRGRVGDIARVTLTNLAENEMGHNIDFHAVTGQGGGAAALNVAPGDTATIDARLLYPGAFMYHCAFGDVPAHIARGMYGMFIVDPAEPLPAVEHEWAVMQSEWYVDEPDEDGVAPFNRGSVTDENPSYVTFNGRTDALLRDNALQMQVGERARIYMVNEGLNLTSNFHPIGSHWDVVYPEAATHPANGVIRGSQSTLVVAGGGTVAEIVGQVPSTILLVDHALARTFDKGALGQIVVSGEENPEVFSSATAGGNEGGEEAPDDRGDEEAPDPQVDALTVAIPEGAFDPANADTAYDPLQITVSVGDTVTWVNDDIIFHTVTSGESDGVEAEHDGGFDSGEIQPGETFSVTFTEAGVFSYFCAPHPWMIGEVVVE